MSELQKKINDIKNQINILLDEIEKLSSEVASLEQYNQRLIYENQQVQESTKSMIKNDKPNALLDMYNRGYHICTVFFSEPLDKKQGCMYCYEVLERNTGEKMDEHIIESAKE